MINIKKVMISDQQIIKGTSTNQIKSVFYHIKISNKIKMLFNNKIKLFLTIQKQTLYL